MCPEFIYIYNLYTYINYSVFFLWIQSGSFKSAIFDIEEFLAVFGLCTFITLHYYLYG